MCGCGTPVGSPAGDDFDQAITDYDAALALCPQSARAHASRELAYAAKDAAPRGHVGSWSVAAGL